MASDEDRYAERLLQQRKAVAAEFNIDDIHDWRVKRLALLQAAHASAEDRMASGGTVDIAPLLALDQAIADVRAAQGVRGHTVQRHLSLAPCWRL